MKTTKQKIINTSTFQISKLMSSALDNAPIPDSKEVKDASLKDGRYHGYKVGNGQVMLQFYKHLLLYRFFILIV